MKYIKTYEKTDLFWEEYNKYEVDDYVLLTADHSDFCVDVAQILNKKKFPIQLYIKTPFRLNNGNLWFGWVNYTEIEKKITQEEYESIKNKNFYDYKIKIDSEKYNL